MVWQILLVIGLLLTSAQAFPAVEVFACEPEWQALAEAVGGDAVTVRSATRPDQDPHHIQARPSLIAGLRRAELLFCTGADLEIGWLPVLVRQAHNPRVQPGKPGYLMAADHVRRLEVPTTLDRRQGDIHAQGNPHVHLDPHNLPIIARVMAERLMAIDPANAAVYRQGLNRFETEWQQALARWAARAEKLRGEGVVVHHRSWPYLLDWLGMVRLATLEPKPGMPPSPSHLMQLESELKGRYPAAIVRSPIDDPRPSQWLSRRTGVAVVVLPATVGQLGTQNLLGLFEEILARLDSSR